MKNIFYTTKLGRYLHRKRVSILFWTGFPLLLLSVPASIITGHFAWVISCPLSILLLVLCINEDAKSW